MKTSLAMLEALEALPPATVALDRARAQSLGTSTRADDAFAHAVEALFAELEQKRPNPDVVAALVEVLEHVTGSPGALSTSPANDDPGIYFASGSNRGLVVKAIGYDAGPADSQRATNLADPTVGYTAVDSAGKKHTGAAQTLADVHERVAEAGWKLVSTKQLPIRYQYWYPLRDWGWDRDECKKQIKKSGLPLPMKSSCFYCPAMKAQEVEELVRLHPELAMRSVRMEEVFRSPHGKFRPEGNINKAGKRVPGTQGLWRGSQMGPFIRHHLTQLVPGYQLVRKKK